MNPRAAYLHVPFCGRRCGYCNFTVAAGRDSLIDEYLRALERELSWLGSPREVDTLFIGGGTPTRLAPIQLRSLLDLARRSFPLAVGGEWTIEANPGDLDRPRVHELARAGITRLSLGSQSFSARKLLALERDHEPEETARAIELARGFAPEISLDLIFAAPGETLDEWRQDLASAIHLGPDHVSTYGLTYERGTTFWSRKHKGQLSSLDESLELAMYGVAIDELTNAGLQHYEVSNFARPGARCRHNEVYWSGGEYFAAGPGAARYVAGRREVNHRSLNTWLKRVNADQSPVAESESLNPEDRAREALFLGLRRIEGVDRVAFESSTGWDPIALFGSRATGLFEHGLIEEDESRIRLTRTGLCVSDSIWPLFLRR